KDFASDLSMRPGERNLVENPSSELLRRLRHHAAAEAAVEVERRLVVGQCPHHHALQPALRQVTLGGREQPPAEAEALEFGAQVKFVDLAVEMQAPRAVAAVVGVAGDLVAEHQYADAAAFSDRAGPPLRAATVDQLGELGPGDDALVGRTPRFV